MKPINPRSCHNLLTFYSISTQTYNCYNYTVFTQNVWIVMVIIKTFNFSQILLSMMIILSVKLYQLLKCELFRNFTVVVIVIIEVANFHIKTSTQLCTCDVCYIVLTLKNGMKYICMYYGRTKIYPIACMLKNS